MQDTERCVKRWQAPPTYMLPWRVPHRPVEEVNPSPEWGMGIIRPRNSGRCGGNGSVRTRAGQSGLEQRAQGPS